MTLSESLAASEKSAAKILALCDRHPKLLGASASVNPHDCSILFYDKEEAKLLLPPLGITLWEKRSSFYVGQHPDGVSIWVQYGQLEPAIVNDLP